MHQRTVTLTELAAVNAARGLAGLGFGLLIAHRIAHRQRTYAGWALLAVGSAIVLPLGLRILMRKDHHRRAGEMFSAEELGADGIA